MTPLKKNGSLYASIFLLTVIPLIVYRDVTHFSFVSWDDDVNIFENPYIADLSLESLKRLWSAPYADLYIPLTYSVWFLAGILGNFFAETPGVTLDPAFFHGANLLLHILNGFLVFLILGIFDLKKYGAPALAGAMFFLLHPAQAEAVSWATGAKDVLAGFFSLLCIYTYLSLRVAEKRSGSFIPFLCFVLALLSKPSSVTLPLVLLSIEYLWYRKKFIPTLLYLTPWLLCSLLAVIICHISQQDKIQGALPLFQQVIVGVDSLGFYLIKLLFPFKLSADYGFSIDTFPEKNEYLLLWIIPLLATLLILKERKERVLPLLLFFLFLLPALGFIPFAFQSISIVADRYMYMAVFGISTGIFLALRGGVRLSFGLPVFVLLVCFALLSSFASGKWSSTYELFSQTLLTNPDSYISWNNLGVYFLKKRNYEESDYYFKKALTVKPDFLLPHFNLGNTLAIRNQLDKALDHYEKALDLDPLHVQLNYNMGIVYSRQGEFPKAFRHFKKVVSVKPDFSHAYFDMGRLLSRQERYDEAISMYKRALKADGGFVEASAKLEELYFRIGDKKRAAFFYKRASNK